MISLEKKAEMIGKILLTKGGIKEAPIMRVAAFYDISGSMDFDNYEHPSRHRIISSGKLQDASNKVAGCGYKFDDNGEVDVFQFDDRCEYVGSMTPKNYETFIRDHHIHARGGTKYSPIVGAARQYFFEEKREKKGGFFGIGAKTVVTPLNDMPVLALILTDGEPASESYYDVERAFKSAAQENIYFHLVGVGGTRRDFPTIAKVADALDNVGEVYLPNFEMTDQEVYDQLITDELIAWIKTHPSKTAQSARA